MNRWDISLIVNGKPRTGSVPPRLLLCDFLRQDLNLVGTHVGCAHGYCGCCTVLVDGISVQSCLMFAVQTDGCEVRTVEGLGTAARMHPIQQAFWEQGALQCGYCTPGMLMSALALLERNAKPSEDEVRAAISSNLCRCTGYETIVSAIMSAAEKVGAESS